MVITQPPARLEKQEGRPGCEGTFLNLPYPGVFNVLEWVVHGVQKQWLAALIKAPPALHMATLFGGTTTKRKAKR
jgi:hypothetical protein